MTLYTKLGCHLCEEAYRRLFEVACDLPLKIDMVDITLPHNRAIHDKYFIRIPVLALAGRQDELNWPFAVEDIVAYLLTKSGETHESDNRAAARNV